MQLVTNTIDYYELAKMAGGPAQDTVLGAIDIRKNQMALGFALHADAAQFLNELGSYPDDIWGFTLSLSKFGTPAFVDCSAPINVRPQQHNRSFIIEDEDLRNKIVTVVTQKIQAHASM
ncbi:MAG TPA: DUF5674 family protein [Candidatus Saccharimonadales bacterium]|nr:DUF5674 family protein [Candidatus Saccharimonadales bacterium]